jgi:hypothetical protein
LTSASFVQEFPEFFNAIEKYPGLVDAKLAEASRRIASKVWGEKTDDGIKYLAAHLLALSPYGQGMRLVAKDGGTVYQETYERLKREVAAGPRLI